jgi:hypothetical protein
MIDDTIAAKQWNVAITIDEHENRTRAVAGLRFDGAERFGGTERFEGVGLARLNPSDRGVPVIGDELAAARALADLSHQLLDAAAEGIERVTHQPAHLRL